MICIITPTFNRAHTLARAYDSLKDQGQEFEWIVVDDASTDATIRLVEEWNLTDSRIRLVKLDKNVGVNGARMAGVRASTAPFVFFLDSDDELMPNALESLQEASRSLDGSIGIAVFPTSSYNDEDGFAKFELNEGRILGEYDIVCERVLEKELSYLYRRDVFDFQGLPEDMRGCEFLFIYGLSRKYLFIASSKKVRNINRQSDNLSSSRGISPRFAEIGAAYLKLVHQHERVLASCSPVRKFYLKKAIIRLRSAGLDTRQILANYRDLDKTTRLFLLVVSLLPKNVITASEVLRIKAINYFSFGRD